MIDIVSGTTETLRSFSTTTDHPEPLHHLKAGGTKSNRDAIGARVRLQAWLAQMREIQSGAVTFAEHPSRQLRWAGDSRGEWSKSVGPAGPPGFLRMWMRTFLSDRRRIRSVGSAEVSASHRPSARNSSRTACATHVLTNEQTIFIFVLAPAQ